MFKLSILISFRKKLVRLMCEYIYRIEIVYHELNTIQVPTDNN